MNIHTAYNQWASQYDTNENKTRDLEAQAIRNILAEKHFTHCLEMGCGTGKNTAFLQTIADQITAIDFSTEMLEKAKQKIHSNKIQFIQADILQDWHFAKGNFDLITFSLVLEHIENLAQIFEKLSRITIKGSIVYIGELHPFKQYAGSKARFETDKGTEIVTCFNHHLSDFTNAAKKYDFHLILVEEQFDNQDSTEVPRILNLVFEKI